MAPFRGTFLTTPQLENWKIGSVRNTLDKRVPKAFQDSQLQQHCHDKVVRREGQ